MPNDLNDLEIQKEIQKILYYIEEFENGNDDYLEEMYVIIEALKDYTKYGKKSYMKAKFILLISKLTTFITDSNIMETDYYKELVGYCNEDIEFYLDSVNKLKEYNRLCKRTGDYPDLEAAYILTIKLSNILENFYAYIHEIRMIEKANSGMFSYYPSGRIREKGLATNEEVSTLTKALSLANEKV